MKMPAASIARTGKRKESKMNYTTPFPSTAVVDFQLEFSDGEILALLTDIYDRSRRWGVLVKPSDLQCFTRFQRKVAEAQQLWIEHFSQTFVKAADRSRAWREAVREGFYDTDKVLAMQQAYEAERAEASK